LIGRTLAGRTLTGRTLIGCLLVARVAILLLRLISRIAVLRLRLLVGRLPILLLPGALLLHLSLTLLHLCTARAHLLMELILLIAAEHAHDLPAKFATRLQVARTSFGMILRIPIDHRLYPLLLIAGKIDVTQAFHPAMRERRMAYGSAVSGLHALRLTLLGVGAERHCERYQQRARRKKTGLHGHHLKRWHPNAPEGLIRTGQAA
jgi:hypothetical protein